MKWLILAPLIIAGSFLAGATSATENTAPANAAEGPSKVEIIERDGKFQLLRNGQPYAIKGAGIDHADLELFAASGGNSFRTWAVDDGALPAKELLDRAHALGLTVSLCLEFAPERVGFDYNDPVAVAKQKEETRARVLANKDHPALLTWFIGNELNFDYTNSKVYDAVNDVAEMIKELDPNHPVTTTIAGFDKRAVKDIQERAPALDFVSFQLYADLANLPKYLKKARFKKPYFVTEWGAVGHWEVHKTKWGAPVEQTSSEKAAHYADSYLKVLEPFGDQAIGNYVFLWGQKQERTSTWYGMFTEDGARTEAVDVMHFIWTGRWPANRAPRISRIQLNGKNPYEGIYLWRGKSYDAEVVIVDYDKDTIEYRWEVRRESRAKEIGGDTEAIPELVQGVVGTSSTPKIKVTAPDEKGAYRLFVYAYDGQGNAAHSNTPFYVK
ncbi:hypothetical protein EYC98_04745 [Halieaceae bacterium IMCC14734]|uniref:Glycoside hydrolase family 2 catalytic domain-containing protein n=1 Tax=Candidatus Litorirhabdus singularis TaxID=2518993 RepID=A0ABT3TCZ6_9GAMM|nr:glycoside hydrolase family 2 TIM barrel-domain containing protein [Candidatus Litorirhabdus singularis]MCX2980173.1 hypothetical protein [Candidatus Litorirhabdus singularis]